MEQIRSGEILYKANLKKQEEKRKLKKLRKEQSLLTQDRNFYTYFNFPYLFVVTHMLPIYCYASCKKFGRYRNGAGSEDKA